MDQLFQFMNSISPVSQDSFQYLFKSCKIKRIKSNETLCEIGDSTETMYLVVDGLLRSYIKDSKGKENNKSFLTSGMLAGSIESILNQTPSNIGITSITNTTLVEINYFKYTRICTEKEDLLTYAMKSAQNECVQKQERLFKLLTCNATERYLDLRKEIYNVDNIISQYHIASYLGITPIQLSRIRKKLFNS